MRTGGPREDIHAMIAHRRKALDVAERRRQTWRWVGRGLLVVLALAASGALVALGVWLASDGQWPL